MRRFLTRSSLALVSAVALAGATLAPASAQEPTPDLISGGNPPAGWIADPSAFSNAFGPLDVGAPQGTVIADSGFRPYPHGFPIPNWGDAQSFINSQLIFGTPSRLSFDDYEAGKVEPPQGLNALSLRRTFGDGVCRDPKTIDPKTGDCELIFGAELLAQSIETGATGGHCFGFAAAAAGLYNGQIPANQVGASGLGVNIANPMGNPAVQTITRLYGAQYFNDTVTAALEGFSPTEVVNTLIRDLQGGTAPFILTVISEKGGHGITPFAVLDRGEGIYDIAVYDNNFPMRARAVTVDTNDDTFTYTSAVNPSAPGIEWSTETEARIGLVSVADMLEEQTCPVCLGPDQGTLVTISPLKADNADNIGIGLVDPSGQPLDPSTYRAISPLNPPTKAQITQPVITIDPSVEQFAIVVNTGDLASNQALELYAISNGEAQYVLLDELASNSTTVFGVGGPDGIAFTSDAPSSPRILQLSDQPGVSFDVNGHPLDLPAGVEVEQQWNTERERIVYRSDAKRTLRWNIQVGGLDNSGGREYVGLNVRVPAGARIVVDYTNASATVPPRAWVRDADGNRKPITLQPVTEQLVNEYRDELYVTRGPGESRID